MKQFTLISLALLMLCLNWLPAAAQDVSRYSLDPINPQTPGRPNLMSDEEVAKEMEMTHGHHHGESSAEDLVSLFKQARTSRGLNHLVFAALTTLQHGHHDDARELAQQIIRAYGEASGELSITPMPNYGGKGECDIDFDNPAALSTQITGDDPQALYTHPSWEQPCGDGILTIDPPVYAHTHLLFEDHTIDCMDLNTGHFGRGEPGNCTPLADAAQEPRYMGAHTGKEVLSIKLINGGQSLPFTVHSFANVGDDAVKFRYRTQGGQWYVWNSLGGNMAWDVSAYVVDVVEVQITNSGTSLACGPDFFTGEPGPCPVDMTPFFLDDIWVSP